MPAGSTDVTPLCGKNGGNTSAPLFANCAPNWMQSDVKSRLLIQGGRFWGFDGVNHSSAHDTIRELLPKRSGKGLAEAGLGRGRIMKWLGCLDGKIAR